jgi:pre-mRNA-splicing factor ISY1
MLWLIGKKGGILHGGAEDPGQPQEEGEEENIYAVAPDSDEDEKQMPEESLQPKFIAYVPVPSQREVEEALLRRKKQELPQKYASESLISESEVKDLLGVHT